MSRYNQLVQKRADLIKEARGVLDLAATEDNRSLTDEELEKHKGIHDAIKVLNGNLEIEEAQLELERNMTPVQDVNAPTQEQADVLHRGQIVSVRDRAENDPNRGFKSPREYMMAVMEQGQGHIMDPRLKPLRITPQAAAGSDEQSGISDPFGGFTVPEGFSPNVLQITPEGDFLAGRTTSVPMDNPVVKFPARVDKVHSTSVSGGLTVTRKPETVPATSSRMKFEQVALTATSQFGFAFATEEILVDSAVSFISMLEQGFDQEFASAHITEVLGGTGIGEPEGVNTCPAMVSQTKEGGQAADTIVYENIIKMRQRVWGYGNAIWVGNHDIYAQLAKMALIIGTGGSAVWQPSAQTDRPDILLGRPLFFTEYAETLGDAGDLLCLNLSEYLEGTLQPLQSAESMHVRFINHERAFKFWIRNDGRSWWRSALTPKKGANTLSPFVRIEART